MNQTKYQALLLGTDPKLAEAVALVLRLDEAGISFAGNCSDALRTLQSQPPDLLLLDFKTSETDCLNLLRQLKQLSAGHTHSHDCAGAGRRKHAGRPGI